MTRSLDVVLDQVQKGTHGQAGVWRDLSTAVYAGCLVPVIGPEISVRNLFGSQVQLEERKRFVDMLHSDLLRHLDGQLGGRGDLTPAGDIDFDVLYLRLARGFLLSMASDEYEPTNGSGAVVGSSEQLKGFQLAIARLAVGCTRVWSLRARQEPKGVLEETMESRAVVSESHVVDPRELEAFWRSLEDAVIAAHDLAEDATQPDELRGEFVYLRVLRLAWELTGPDSAFWANAERRARLVECMYGAHTDGRAGHDYSNLGWALSETGAESDEPGEDPGVRLSHVRWLSNLLRHTLVSNTRAYRTPSETAFALTLAPDDCRLGRTTLDPSAACYWQPEDGADGLGRADETLLRELLERACLDGTGGLRKPTGLHQALARLVHLSMQRAREKRLEHGDASEPRGGLIISTSLDLEMEVALAELELPFHVLVPVHLNVADDASAEADGPFLEYVGWLWGSYEPLSPEQRTPEALTHPRWYGFDPPTALDRVNLPRKQREEWTFTQNGPLLIKACGSPLHALPENKWASGQGIAKEGFKARAWHRLIVGETDVLDFMEAGAPEALGLPERLMEQEVFFFGQDVSSVGRRLQDYAVRAAGSAKTPNARTRVQPHPALAFGIDRAPWRNALGYMGFDSSVATDRSGLRKVVKLIVERVVA